LAHSGLAQVCHRLPVIQADSVLRPVAEKYKLRELENDDWDTRKIKDADAEDTPVILKKLKVTRPPNTYILNISYQAKDKRLAADVANGIAQSYLEHTYAIRYNAFMGVRSDYYLAEETDIEWHTAAAKPVGSTSLRKTSVIESAVAC